MADKLLAKVKRWWVTALRSGKYKKTTGDLRGVVWDDKANKHVPTGAFCALGVLCDIYEKKTKKKVDYARHGNLPPKVQKWAGLAVGDPELNGHGTVADVNDGGLAGKKVGFKRIASLIEKYL